MFRSLYDWAVINRGRFGEMSFTFALTYLWVMTILLIMNVAAFAGAAIELGATITQMISVVPNILAEYTPQITADAGMSTFVLAFITTCIIAPLVEEMFRAALLQFACEDKDTGEMKNFFLIMAMSFIFFGMLHGGYMNILIQGVLGLLLARLWFKVWKGKPTRTGYLWRYFSMVAVHAAYNFCIMGTQLMVLRAIS